MTEDVLRIEVIASPNRAYQDAGAVLLTFANPCPHCRHRHVHGAPSAELDADGTYGRRVAHCGRHTHDLTPAGRPRRLGTSCLSPHGEYVLVPVSDAR